MFTVATYIFHNTISKADILNFYVITMDWMNTQKNLGHMHAREISQVHFYENNFAMYPVQFIIHSYYQCGYSLGIYIVFELQFI